MRRVHASNTTLAHLQGIKKISADSQLGNPPSAARLRAFGPDVLEAQQAKVRRELARHLELYRPRVYVHDRRRHCSAWLLIL
jgi:hypothetical protein